MKTFLFLLGLVAAGIVGYSFEPDLRFSLTGKEAERRTVKPPIVAASAASTSGSVPRSAADIDPSSLTPEQLPKQVILKTNVDITDESLDLKVTITAGNPVDLIRIEGGNAVISPGSEKYQATVAISDTDLMEQLTAPPVEEPEVVVTPPPAPETTVDPFAETAPTPSNEPETTATADPTAPVDTTAAVDPADAVDPDPVAVSDPDPEPSIGTEPTPPPSAPPASVSGDSVVAVMQSSIKGGEIKEFTYDQVLNWEASPQPETIDGEPYQTGIASYKAETVFGVKTIQAKALIKGGKVVKWLWPKSGMEIK